MCLDTLKITSDDAVFTEDHIVFLLNKYRSILLQQKYSDVRNPISSSNYQTLCLDLTLDNTKSRDVCKGTILRSVEKIPNLLNIGNTEVSLKEFNKTYKLLGVDKFDSYAGESFYNDKMDRVINELKAKNLLVESEGAQVVIMDEDIPPCII